MNVEWTLSPAIRKVAILHNLDQHLVEEGGEEDGEPPSRVANEEVIEVALHIKAALESAGVEVEVIPVCHRMEEALPSLLQARPQVVVNLVESLGGESHREVEAPPFFEELGLPYTGNNRVALWMSGAKDQSRQALLRRGVPMARGWCVERGEGLPQEALEGPFPLFVKPARTHASIGIDRHSVVGDERALRARLAYLEERFEGPFLIEEFLPGREINVAVFPEPEGGIYALTEIDFSAYPSDLPKIVTYNCKWVPGTPDYNAESKPAEERLTVEERREVKRVAREALLALGATGYGRVDMRFDAAGRPKVIDVNPNNDIHPEAGMAIAASCVGVDYRALVFSLVETAYHTRKHAPAPHTTQGSGELGLAAGAY
jgi:D-alanine-D-alanine ligase